MKAICVILSSFTCVLSAQTIITIQGGSNFRTGPFSVENNILTTDSWKSSTTALGALDVIIKRPFAISASLEYDYYPFSGYPASDITIPEYTLKSSSGEATRIFRASIEGKLRPPSVGRFSLYFVSGVSYNIEHIGELSYIEGTLEGPNNQLVYPSQSNYYWAHTFGLGFQYSFSEHYGIDFTAKYYSNYTTRFHKLAALGLFYEL
jgi:hypothetical protein